MGKVVVQGGFLGTTVPAALQQRGYDVEACSRRSDVDARDEQCSRTEVTVGVTYPSI